MIDSDLISQLKDKLSLASLLDIYPSIFDKAEVAKLILDPQMGFTTFDGICPNCNNQTILRMINQDGTILINAKCCDSIFGFPHPITIQKLNKSVLGEVKCLV